MQWNSRLLAFSLIIEGTTEKVLQFIVVLKSIYNKNLGFIEVFLNTIERFKTRKTLINIFMVMGKFF
jgi:hypothetical protein